MDGRRTLSNVVIAYVATLLLGSEIKPSKSTLQLATLVGCNSASEARVRVAANFRTGLGDDKNSCKTGERDEGGSTKENL
jgi:hypothetical protein